MSRVCLGALVLLLLSGCDDNNIGGGEGDGGTNGNDGNPCPCISSLDEPGWGALCVRENLECNALTPCPEGYTCREPYCVCNDVAICGVACTADCDCPAGTRCFGEVGYCRAPPPCFGIDDCAADEICAGDYEYSSGMPFCQPAQGSGVGAACDYAEECASGICYTNVCLQRCQRNADCPSGQTCEVTQRGTGCVVVSECASCDEPERVCDMYSCIETCNRSGDCEDLCELDLHDLIGRCEDRHYLDCEDHEVVLRAFGVSPSHGNYCFIPQGCWVAEDCPTDYGCVYDWQVSARTGGVGVCARFVPDSGYVEPPDNPCPCAMPGDTVVYDDTCVQGEVGCDAQTPCPSGYECYEDSCWCVDVDVCGMACDASCGCPVGMACDPVRGVCRDALPCLDDTMCPSSERCQMPHSDDVHLMYPYCQVPREGAVGDACQSEWDCASAICELGLCRQRCHTNADCPAAEKCTTMMDGLGCRPMDTCSGGVCDAPDQLCDNVCVTGCRTSADCPDLCEVNLRDVGGTCQESSYRDCGPDEVDLWSFGSYLFTGYLCFIYNACWLGDDCPLGYDCIWDEIDTTDATALGYAGLCARLVPDP